MVVIKICLYTEGKEYVCPYTCEHYNMHTNLLNICKYENGKKSHSCRFCFGNYSEIGYLFMFIGHLLIYFLFCQLPVYVFLPFSFWLIYLFPFNLHSFVNRKLYRKILSAESIVKTSEILLDLNSGASNYLSPVSWAEVAICGTGKA